MALLGDATEHQLLTPSLPTSPVRGQKRDTEKKHFRKNPWSGARQAAPGTQESKIKKGRQPQDLGGPFSLRGPSCLPWPGLLHASGSLVQTLSYLAPHQTHRVLDLPPAPAHPGPKGEREDGSGSGLATLLGLLPEAEPRHPLPAYPPHPSLCHYLQPLEIRGPQKNKTQSPKCV